MIRGKTRFPNSLAVIKKPARILGTEMHMKKISVKPLLVLTNRYHINVHPNILSTPETLRTYQDESWFIVIFASLHNCFFSSSVGSAIICDKGENIQTNHAWLESNTLDVYFSSESILSATITKIPVTYMGNCNDRKTNSSRFQYPPVVNRSCICPASGRSAISPLSLDT